MRNTRTEVIAAMILGMIFSYFLGFHDGARYKHHVAETAGAAP